MACELPTAIIGEFDALEGPKVVFAFQYFGFHTSSFSEAHGVSVALLDAPFYCGRDVASGVPPRQRCSHITSVVAHALATRDTHEESIILQDPVAGSVASLNFSLSDILARGEKRSFCVLLTHPCSDELVARWPVIISVMQLMAQTFIRRTHQRRQRDYARFGNLEKMREAAREKPLRSLLELLCLGKSKDFPLPTECRAAHASLPDQDSMDPSSTAAPESMLREDGSQPTVDCCKKYNIFHDAAMDHMFQQIHCFFDCVLPAAFSRSKPLPFPLSLSSAAVLALLRARIEKEIPVLQSHIRMIGSDSSSPLPAEEQLGTTPRCRKHSQETPWSAAQRLQVGRTENISLLCETNASTYTITGGSTQPLRQGHLRVPSLAEWLLDANPSANIGLLLDALFSGHQVLVTGSDPEQCASLAVAMAQVLPLSLRQVTLFSSEYLMPYQCRILTFSPNFTNRYSIVPVRKFSNVEQFVLSELEADNVVHVSVCCKGSIELVEDCDTLLSDRMESRSALAEDEKFIRGTRQPLPSIVSSILHAIRISHDMIAAESAGSKWNVSSESFYSTEHTSCSSGSSFSGDGQAPCGDRKVVSAGAGEFRGVTEDGNCGKADCLTKAALLVYQHRAALLQMHMKRVVREYVLRGRIYTRLHRREEQVKCSAMLGIAKPKVSLLQRVIKKVYSSSPRHGRGGLEYHGTSSHARHGTARPTQEKLRPRPELDLRYRHVVCMLLRASMDCTSLDGSGHIGASDFYSGRMEEGSEPHFSSATDHDVLLFLGSSSPMF